MNFSARPTSYRTSYYNPIQTKTSTEKKERKYIITYDSSSSDEFQKENLSNIEQYNLRQKNVKVIQGTRYKKTEEIANDQLSRSQKRFQKTIYSNYTPERLDNNISEGVFFKEKYTPIDFSKMRIFANQNRNYAKFYFPLKELSYIEKEIIQDAPINWLLGKPDEFYYRSRTPYPKFEYQYQPNYKVTKITKTYYNQPKRYYYVEEHKNNYVRPGRFSYQNEFDKAATLISSHWKGHRVRVELNDFLRKNYDYNNEQDNFDDVYYESNIPRNYYNQFSKKKNYNEGISNDNFRKSYLFKKKILDERNENFKKNIPQRNSYRNRNNSNEIIEKYININSNDSNEYINNSNEINENYKTIISNESNEYKYINSKERNKVHRIPKEYNDYRNINNSHDIIQKYRAIISKESNLNNSNEKYENKLNINISSNDKIEDNKRKNKPNEKIDNLKRYNIKKEIVDNKRNISPNDNVQNIKPNEKVSNYKNIITKERVDNKGNVVKETTTKSIITNSKNKNIKSPNNNQYYEEETEEIKTTKKPIYNIEKTERKIKDNNKEIIETEDIEVTINQEEIQKKKIIQNVRGGNNKNYNTKELATKKLANTLNKKVIEEENILIDNLNKNRTEKRIEDGINKISNYMRKSSNKEVFDKINESNKEDENEIKLKSTPIVLDKNIKFKSKPNVLKKIDIEEEIIPVISGSGNEMKEDEKVILKNDLNIARRQTLTNLIVKKQTIQYALDDNDDYDYEKEFLEMENNAKIGKFFDKAKERLRYYFNMFRRKTENYVEDIEEEIIDETQNDKKEGLNKLKNIMDNANKNKGMKALKDNQKNEKIKENLNKFNKIMVDKEKQKGMDVLKDNQKTEIKKEKLNKLGDIFQQKSKSKVMNALKQNKKDEEIKEQLTKLNTLIIEKEKNKTMTTLKQKQNK